MKIKQLACLFITAVFATTFVFTVSAYTRDDIVEYKGVGSTAALRWMVTSGGKFKTSVANRLPSSHPAFGQVTGAISNFNSQSPSKISSVVTTYNNANVMILQASSLSWDAHNYYSLADAVTIPRSSSGISYYNFNQIPDNTSIDITYAEIWFNPNTLQSRSSAEWKRIVMHEMLHVYGMGEYSGASLTNPGYYPTLTTLTSYDIFALSNMYI